MNILDRLFAGNIIKDFGTLDEKNLGIGKIRHSALLSEKYGRYYFVIKMSAYALFGASANYQFYPLEDATKIREYINESEQIVRNLPPIQENIGAIAIRNMLIVLTIAAVLIVIAPTGILFTFIAFIIQINQFLEFRDHPKVDPGTKRTLLLIMLGTIAIGVIKIAVMAALGLNQIDRNLPWLFSLTLGPQSMG